MITEDSSFEKNTEYNRLVKLAIEKVNELIISRNEKKNSNKGGSPCI